ncbi:MAG: adenosylcobinamide-GDP ribazoletransferase [Desulfocapsaceae bacterium]
MSELQKAVRQPLRSFSAALRFLTIFPFFSTDGDDQQYFGAARYYFTLVGLAVGCFAAVCALLLYGLASPLVSAVLLAIILSFASGFLHMDGLADTADGFLSSRDRERCLEIMKDSRIGVMGAIIVCAVLLLKSAAIFSLAEQDIIGGLICAAVAGRAAMVVAMYFMTYARPEGGLGLLFNTGEQSYVAPLISILLLLLVVILLLPGKLLVIGCAFILILMVFSIWCRKKIGGFTGDTLGCLCEFMETGILLATGLLI